MRLWGGRFGDGPDARMADFTRSIEVDAELALDDIAGSIAHVRGLGRAGLLTEEEVQVLERGLVSLRDDVVAGTVAWDPALEDVHMNLETHADRARRRRRRQAPHGALAQRPGRHWTCGSGRAAPSGGWTRGSWASSGRWWTSPSARATPSCPGTTHIQPAQPVLLAHHLLAYVEMLERDRGRLADARRRLNVSPLGAGRARRRRVPARPRGDRGGARLRRRDAPTRSTRSRIGTSWSRCSRRPRSRWSTSPGSPRRSPGGRTRASGSCASPTRSPPAPR